MLAALAVVRRVLHRGTASLYARLPKCGNNVIRLMLFAQYGASHLPDSDIKHQWREVWGHSKKPGMARIKGMQWDKRQFPPGGSFKPVIVRTLKPHPTLPTTATTHRTLANSSSWRAVLSSRPQSRAWTFVRDPLSHFVSGFTEAAMRSNQQKMKQLNAGKAVAPFTIQSFVQFLEQLVTGHGALKNAGFHMHPMSELALIQPQVHLPTTCRVLLHLQLREPYMWQRPVTFSCHHASHGQCADGLDWLQLLPGLG